MSGYFIKLEKIGSPRLWSRHIYSSCHNEGINVTALEEHQSYCVYVAAFNKYGQGNGSSCIVAVTGEKGTLKVFAFCKESKWLRGRSAMLAIGTKIAMSIVHFRVHVCLLFKATLNAKFL